VNAYVANATVQDQQYADVLGSTNQPVQERLGNTVDQVEQNLGVLLDPIARVKYAASGFLSQLVAVVPDYRNLQRPVVRWTFNSQASPVPDAEGNGPTFTAMQVDLSGKTLLAANVPSGARTCQSTQPVALGNSRQFTIMANVQFSTVAGAFTLFQKDNGAGDRLWIEATTSDANTLSLVMKDGVGGVATFPPITRDMQGGWGLVALVADDGAYRLHQFMPGSLTTTTLPASSVVNGGPSWGGPGTVSLACELPGVRSSCTSWDRNVPGDGLDVLLQQPNPRDEISGEITRHCTETCNTAKPPVCHENCSDAEPGTVCSSQATTRKAVLTGMLFPNPPQPALDAFQVIGHAISTQTRDGRVIAYKCDVKISNQPFPLTGIKPACPNPHRIAWDEVSLWDRPVQPEELTNMAARFGFVSGNESLPPRTSAPLPGNEQAAGLAVHLLEAVDADLHLLATYLDAERNLIYTEWFEGRQPVARDRAMNRAGRNLRMALVLADEAASLASAPGVTTAGWYKRYQADQQKLAGSRRRAVEALKRALDHENPLGIAEDDLPLYNGDIHPSAALQFYADSAYLSEQASRQISHAHDMLTAARDAYNAQQQAKFQEDTANQNTGDRINNLRVTYESSLRKYCGAPGADEGPHGTQTLLDGFRNGTFTTSNCFLKTDIPACQAFTASTPVAAIPASCLRGEIGELVVAIKTAAVDSANAKSSFDRATDEYNAAADYCTRLQAVNDSIVGLFTAREEVMEAVRKEARDMNLMTGLFMTAIQVESPTSFMSFNQTAVSDMQASLSAEAQDAEFAFQGGLQWQRGKADVMACHVGAGTKHAAIGAAVDLMQKAAQAMTAAAFGLGNAQSSVAAMADEGSAQISREATIDRTPPHLHYWLDDDIKTYQRDMSYARRLTYLALRAFEYESQTSIGHRGDVLMARNPDDLGAVITAIGQHNGPLEGSQSFSVGHEPKVMSLRDDILHMDGLATNTTPLPGMPALDARAVFQRYLSSDASKVYDRNTKAYLGRGFRLSLAPDTSAECAERIVRITSSVQTSNNAAPHSTAVLLYQENAFGSQSCAAGETGVVFSRVQPSHNLLVDDTPVSYQEREPMLSLSIDGPANKDIDVLKTWPNDGTLGFAEGFASRGLYGNYILLFPKCESPSCTSGYTETILATVTDVILRFDIVFGTKGGTPQSVVQPPGNH
jgi:hypothetical protein